MSGWLTDAVTCDVPPTPSGGGPAREYLFELMAVEVTDCLLELVAGEPNPFTENTTTTCAPSPGTYDFVVGRYLKVAGQPEHARRW